MIELIVKMIKLKSAVASTHWLKPWWKERHFLCGPEATTDNETKLLDQWVSTVHQLEMSDWMIIWCVDGSHSQYRTAAAVVKSCDLPHDCLLVHCYSLSIKCCPPLSLESKQIFFFLITFQA